MESGEQHNSEQQLPGLSDEEANQQNQQQAPQPHDCAQYHATIKELFLCGAAEEVFNFMVMKHDKNFPERLVYFEEFIETEYEPMMEHLFEVQMALAQQMAEIGSRLNPPICAYAIVKYMNESDPIEQLHVGEEEFMPQFVQKLKELRENGKDDILEHIQDMF